MPPLRIRCSCLRENLFSCELLIKLWSPSASPSTLAHGPHFLSVRKRRIHRSFRMVLLICLGIPAQNPKGRGRHVICRES